MFDKTPPFYLSPNSFSFRTVVCAPRDITNFNKFYNFSGAQPLQLIK